MIKIGLFGYSQSGKTYIFKKLTGKKDEIFDPFKPNLGIGIYRDERMEKLKQIVKPKKIFYPEFEIFDIKGFPEGEGFPQNYFKNFYDLDILVFVVKNFSPDSKPEEEIESLFMELIFHDIEKIEKIIETRKNQGKDLNIWEKSLEILKNGKFLKDVDIEKREILGAGLLTLKEFLIFLNGNQKEIKIEKIVIKEIEDFYKKIIEQLKMITFYTIKGDILQGWIIPSNLTAKQAAGKIHKDIEKGFVKAAVLHYKDFIEISDWNKAKNMGILKFLGPNSFFSDGDVVEFYFTK